MCGAVAVSRSYLSGDEAQTLFDIKRDYAASISVWERIAALASTPVDAATARGYVLRAQEWLGGRKQPAPGTGSR